MTTDVNNCSVCGAVCQTTAPNMTSRQCLASACKVATCGAGYYDQDAQISNGCECAADTAADSCVTAGSLGTIGVDGTTSVSNNLTPTTTDSDWYTVTFATGPSCNFGPKIQVTGDAVAKIRVFTSCPSALATGLDCSEGGLSTKDGLSVWEFTYTGGIGACGSLNSIDPYPYYYGSFVTVATTVWIQVYATATTNSCGTYTVTVTN